MTSNAEKFDENPVSIEKQNIILPFYNQYRLKDIFTLTDK